MNNLVSIWHDLNEPQATILAAVLTVLAAIVGVILGWWLFSGRVKDLQSTLEETETILNKHRDQVEATLQGIAGRLAEMDEQFTGIQEALGQLRGSVNVLESSTGSGGTDAQMDAREALREGWAAIRDKLEKIAADPKIDGRTRARYARIDRRRYADLIDALERDGRLGVRANLYSEAVALFHRYRNGRQVPSTADVERMRTICEALL
ncbi:MAG: DUF4175 family protein [Caulobacter sp.]|jgi:hypothetical protein